MTAFFSYFIIRKPLELDMQKYISLEKSFSDLINNLTFNSPNSPCVNMEEFMRPEGKILIL